MTALMPPSASRRDKVDHDWHDHPSVVLSESERAAAFCVSGAGHRWVYDSPGRYLCEECDTSATTEGRI